MVLDHHYQHIYSEILEFPNVYQVHINIFCACNPFDHQHCFESPPSWWAFCCALH